MLEEHPIAGPVVTACGIIYFTAWSLSFYPQIILNYKRKTTAGLSPDFIYINPAGFLAITTWNFFMHFSPLARKQYRARHDGHEPQISPADLAYSAHALVISIIALAQIFWYHRRNRQIKLPDDTMPLLPLVSKAPTTPSIFCQIALGVIFAGSFAVGVLVWVGRAEFLDWLYYASYVKLVVSIIKYVPQVILNWQLKSAAGFAIGGIIGDVIGSIFSFTQLVVSSIYIEHDPTGIVGNPGKLGLACMSLLFDTIFLVQRYWMYRGREVEEVEDTNERETDDEL